MARRPRRKRVAVVTGSRAEYGLLTSTLAAIEDSPRLELQLVVTGMHLLSRFGRTIREIEADGWRIAARVPMQRGDDAVTDQAQGLGRGVAGLARAVERLGSDVVLVLGDRIEAMAAALAAVTTGRAVAHIHGGDVAPGDFDDSLRHAITKLAHMHLAATRDAARRIVRLGERADRVHVVGAPGLDRLRELLRGRARRGARSGTALVVHHAYGRDAAREQAVATNVLRAVADAGLRRVIVYPNSDRGHSGVLRAIERHAAAARNGDVRLHRSLPRDAFLDALLAADVLVGNSSAGVIEAPFAGTPSVNVGQRQRGRMPGGPSVIHAPEQRAAVRAAIAAALRKRPRAGASRVYGDGQAGRRIAAVLERQEVTPELLRKRIAY